MALQNEIAAPLHNARGGQPGNENAIKHGLYVDQTKDKKASGASLRGKARRGRARQRAAAEALVQEILTAAGLSQDPIALFLGSQMARLEAKVRYLEDWHRDNGLHSKGVLRPSVLTEIQTIDRLLGEIRRLLEVLSAGREPEAAEYRVRIEGAGEIKPQSIGGSA